MSFYLLYPRWKFRFVSCNALWGNPITSQFSSVFCGLSSHFPPLCDQPWRALPGFLPAPPWSTYLLQDLPYQPFKTAVPNVPKPPQVGKCPWSSLSAPLHGGGAHFVVSEHWQCQKWQSRRSRGSGVPRAEFCWPDVVWLACIWKYFPISARCPRNFKLCLAPSLWLLRL